VIEVLAVAFWTVVAVWFGVGVLFAIPFLARGIGRIDPLAARSGLAFRLVVVPGVMALWPVLASRWLSGRREPPEEAGSHRRAARSGRTSRIGT
jgi:hypothetical protein